MNKVKKLLALGLLAAAAALPMKAQTTTTADDIVDNVGGITTKASTSYVGAAGLGVAALTVGTIVYMSRRGWKLR